MPRLRDDRHVVLLLAVVAAALALGSVARGQLDPWVGATLVALCLALAAHALRARRLERTAVTLQAVMDATPVGLLAAREGVAVYANPAALALFGFHSADQLVGRRLLDFVLPEDTDAVRRSSERWREGVVPPPRRLRIRGVSGEVVVDSLPLGSLVEIDGAPAQLALLQKVEDKDGLEQRLARQATNALAIAELSRCLVEARFDLKQMLDTVARLTSPAPDEVSLVRLWSKDQTEVSGGVAMHAHDPAMLALAGRFNTPSRTGSVNALVLQARKALTLRADDIRKNATPDTLATLGDSIPHELALVPLRGQGRVLGLLAVGRYQPRAFDETDLTFLQDMCDRAGQALLNAQLYEEVSQALAERERAAEALRSTEAQLRHSQKLEALGQLAGGVAHDFNNLLSVILSLSEMLLDGRAADDPERDDLVDIQAAGVRASELTKQLLAFSRKQVMQPRPLAVNDVVGGLESILRRLLGEELTLVLELAPELPTVHADPSLLSQVVMNLVVNARDVMPGGGRIVLRTTLREAGDASGPVEVSGGRYVCLSVTDEGVGLSPEVKEHLFEPFFTTKPRGKGTGLGLSTSYGIARQSGGTITAESEGKGATFTLWLPATDGTPESAAAPPSDATKKGRGVIFLVEDEPLVRDVAHRLLSRAGYTLHVAGSAEEALQLAPSLGELDLLLTDVVMPGQNGRELADQLLVARPNLGVLYMSGYTEDMVVKRGVLEGQVALLQKPFTPRTLLEAVERALRPA